MSQRKRTTKKGKVSTRTTIEIESEPLVHVFDDTALGAGPAQAIKEALERGIKAINQTARPSTLAFRRRARKALTAGASWAKNRYKPLRGDATNRLPGHSDRLFNDSNTLAEGLFVRQNTAEKNFTVNVPSSRFTSHTEHLAERLVQLVPALSSPRSMLNDREVTKAIEESLDLLIAKARNIADAKRAQMRLQQLNAAKAVLNLFRTLGGI